MGFIEKRNGRYRARANRDGMTWRQIGAELGVPFQTLYRRYGEGAR